jgi:polyisoprenoid-binding protein YceI
MESTTIVVTPGTYRLDPIHSSVGFAVLHKVSKFRGGFGTFDATLIADADGALALSGSAGVASVQVKDPTMAAHLQSPDFFDAERHPDATFRSTSVRAGADGTLAVSGELTLRGTTRAVEATGMLTFVADDGHGRPRVGLDLETVIDRNGFGISFAQELPGGGVNVESAVTLSVELELAGGGPA